LVVNALLQPLKVLRLQEESLVPMDL